MGSHDPQIKSRQNDVLLGGGCRYEVLAALPIIVDPSLDPLLALGSCLDISRKRASLRIKNFIVYFQCIKALFLF
jgi:hypothetical protein